MGASGQGSEDRGEMTAGYRTVADLRQQVCWLGARDTVVTRQTLLLPGFIITVGVQHGRSEYMRTQGGAHDTFHRSDCCRSHCRPLLCPKLSHQARPHLDG